MHLTYYTLRAMAREWADPNGEFFLVGATILDAYSSARDELTMEFQAVSGDVSTLRVSVQPGFRYIFRQSGSGRPRRNATSLLQPVLGRAIASVEVADRDRVLDLTTENGLIIRTMLFGPRANVLVGTRHGNVQSAFREKVAPATLPEPRAAPDPEEAQELAERWPDGAQPVPKALARAAPLFDIWLAREAVSRAALDVSDACLLEDHHFQRLSDALQSVRESLESPHPTVYRKGRSPIAFSLIPLAEPPGEASTSETVDSGVSSFVRSTLSERSFLREYDPMLRGLEKTALKSRKRADAMLRELSEPSRADKYERWGHLLMAGAVTLPAGQEEIQLPDLFAGGDSVMVPLDPSASGRENADRYYDKARRTRRAREEAEQRMESVDRARISSEALVEELRGISDRKALKAFRQSHANALAALRGRDKEGADSVPFRRYFVGEGYEVWVGRNAKQNDDLTFQCAGKHDFWLHARGIAGSHTVLRRSSKTAEPPKWVVEKAASIAAYHSKARGSGLVPVIVTERKYVRKARKGPPGAVLVEREEVLIVPPRLPDTDSA